MDQPQAKGPDDFIVCQLLGEDNDSTVSNLINVTDFLFVQF